MFPIACQRMKGTEDWDGMQHGWEVSKKNGREETGLGGAGGLLYLTTRVQRLADGLAGLTCRVPPSQGPTNSKG